MLKRATHIAPERWLARDEGHWVSGELRLETDVELRARLGEPHDAADLWWSWFFEAECGLQFVVRQRVEQTPAGAQLGTTLEATCRSELDHARLHLPFAAASQPSTVPELSTGYVLIRLDDNGQETVVGAYPALASARCVEKRLSSGGHKQTYSIRHLDPLPALVCDVGAFELWRRDDNGQRFLVTRHATRAMAERHLAELEREPRHKHVYWVKAR